MTAKITAFLNTAYFNNKLLHYLIAIAVFLAGILIVKIFRKVILSRLHKWTEITSTTIDDFLITTIEKTVLPLSYYGIFFIATKGLVLNQSFKKIFNVIGIIIFSIYGIRFINRLIEYLINNYLKNEDAIRIPKGIITLMKVIVWIFGMIFLLDNLGFKVSTVITGLGIGGIAVALSSQTFLKDIFNYFVIIIDKPFVVGDFVDTGVSSGIIEHIGIKTTKLRSLYGEQIIVPNTALTDSNIKNYKRMDERSVNFTINVACDTDNQLLEKIPGIIQKAIESFDGTTFQRAFFKSFGTFTLDFDIFYTINTSDYAEYVKLQQNINLKIKEMFEKEGITMPYPTQKVLVQNS